MHVEFVGAASTVTGSKHLVRTRDATVLLDCGLFQGRRAEAFQKNRDLGLDAASIDAVVLSHAHIDHSGALPILVKHGFKGDIYTTPATRDLVAVMLADSAYIQAADARHIQRQIERHGSDMAPVVPLYDPEDVVPVLNRIITLPYGRKQRISSGMSVTLLDAGHVLGSAIVVLDIDDGGSSKRVVFTGDLGRKGAAILRDPEIPAGTESLIMESTYGDKLHPSHDRTIDDLATIIRATYERGGKIVIPSFALERAQELLYAIKGLRDEKRIPKLPVYLDSPLSVKITEVFKLHPECFDAELRKMLREKQSPFDFDEVSYVSEVEDSKSIDASDAPAIIISASGMCEGGRVLHHLKATIEDQRNAVVLVGFQAEHTLGRRIAEKHPRVRIFGVEYDLRAEVAVLDGFSAHADQAGLVDYAESIRGRGSLRQVALVHGEPTAAKTLASLLQERRFSDVIVPVTGDKMAL